MANNPQPPVHHDPSFSPLPCLHHCHPRRRCPARRGRSSGPAHRGLHLHRGLRQQCRRRRHRPVALGQASYGYGHGRFHDAYGVSILALDGNSPGQQTNGSTWTSGPFNATAGDQIDVWFNYASTDGKGFDDYAWGLLAGCRQRRPGGLALHGTQLQFQHRQHRAGRRGDEEGIDPRDRIVNYDSYKFTSKTVDDPIDWQPLGGSNGTCWRDNAAGCGFTGWLQSCHAFASRC